MIITARAREHS